MTRCLRAQGIEIADLPDRGVRPVATPMRRYDPTLAATAWAACRLVFLAATQGSAAGAAPPAQIAFRLALPDCMATRGWFSELQSGPPADQARWDTDRVACQAAADAANPVHAVEQCLRERGVELGREAEPQNRLTRRVEPRVALAAWLSCRSIHVANEGYAAGTFVTELVLPDCMATKGWLVIVMPQPPLGVEGDAWDADLGACGAAYEQSPGGPAGAPTRPSASEWAACFREQGIEVAVPSGSAGRAPQRFDAAPVQAAFVACTIRHSGVLLGVAVDLFECSARRGIVPGFSGPGTWEELSGCGLSASTVTGRVADASSDAFLRCLVENGLVLHPFLRTIDAVRGPWERCIRPDERAAGNFALPAPDRSEVDLRVLRHWDCLAAAGLRRPDPRDGEAQIDLAAARGALAVCRSLAVAVVRRPAPRSED